MYLSFILLSKPVDIYDSFYSPDRSLQSGMDDSTQTDRQGKFLLYWITTTTTSTTTSFTATSTIGSLACTPAGFTNALCG